MGTKTHGPRRYTREKFRGPKKLTVNRLLGSFSTGDRVAVVISSNSERGQPFRRFQGLTGQVIGKRGRSFIVELRDRGKLKKIISGPEHLKRL